MQQRWWYWYDVVFDYAVDHCCSCQRYSVYPQQNQVVPGKQKGIFVICQILDNEL